MAHGETLAKWAESCNALQSRRNASCSEEESEGLGRCLDLFTKRNYKEETGKERDLRLLLVSAASEEKDLALPCCKRETATTEVRAASGSKPLGSTPCAVPHHLWQWPVPLVSTSAGRIRAPYCPSCCRRHRAGAPHHWGGCRACGGCSRARRHPWSKTRRAPLAHSALCPPQWRRYRSSGARWRNGKTGGCRPWRGRSPRDCAGIAAAGTGHPTSPPA